MKPNAKPIAITAQEEADAAFGAGSFGATAFRDFTNPTPPPADGKNRVYGLAAMTEEEREEFSRCVDAAISGDEDESAEAVKRLVELANGDEVK